MNKLFMVLAFVLLSGTLQAQAQIPIRYFNLASDATVNMGAGEDTTSITISVPASAAAAAVAYVAFPNTGRSYSNGKVMVEITTGAAMTLKLAAYPCRASYNATTQIVTLTVDSIKSSAWTPDSLEIMNVATGVSLANASTIALPIKSRASGDDLPWGPCDGLKIVAVKTDATAENLTIRVRGQ